MQKTHSWYLTGNSGIPPCGYRPNIFSAQECQQIIATGLQETVTEAGVDGISGDMGHPLRKNRVSWLNSSDPAQHWIFHRLLDLIMDINRSYRYDLMFLESLQFTIYDQQGDHYGYHTDFNPEGLGGNIRKISFSVQLSSESDYQGGDLEMMICDTGKFNAVKDQGSVTFFPSYTMHRVTPITQGVRYSLVGWVMGPPFK